MTARRLTAEKAAEQARVIAALEATGDARVAGRLRRCMEAMTSRRQNGGYPWTCRGPGCAWCRVALARRWWRGMRLWMDDGGARVSLLVLPLPHVPGGLRAAVARLRRACRDVRDRAARRRAAWRVLALAGMATGGGPAFLLVRHPRIDGQEVAEVFGARWPAATVFGVGAVEPSWAMAIEDGAELARIRRGVEPLRVVILPQRAAARARAFQPSTGLDTSPSLAPMPIVF